MPRFVFASFMGLALTFSAPALAHIALTKSAPAANATVAKPVRIALTFNEKPIVSQFKSELVMVSMPGMTDHPPMKISGHSSQMSADGKTVTLLLKQVLPVGGYVLKWRATGADGHQVTGEIPFSAR